MLADIHEDETKKMFFERKKMANSKKLRFSTPPILIFFCEKILRIGGVEKLSFFESAIWNFFLLHPNENQSTFIM